MSYGYEGKLLKEFEEKTKPKVEKFLLFEENEAAIEYVCNGHILKEGNTFSDIYGEMTCKDAAIEDAKEIVKRLKLKKNSDLVIQVKVKTYHINKRKTGYEFKRYEHVGYPDIISDKVMLSSSDINMENKNRLFKEVYKK